jgi:hypothetical protein
MYFSTPAFLTLALAGQALSRAADRVCTAASSATLVWRINTFEFQANETTVSPNPEFVQGIANFTLENSALGYKTVCRGESQRKPDYFYGDIVYDCAMPADAAGDKTSFSFTRKTRMLEINQTWACEKDGSHFSGHGVVKLQLACNEMLRKNRFNGKDFSSRTEDCAVHGVPVKIKYLAGTE